MAKSDAAGRNTPDLMTARLPDFRPGTHIFSIDVEEWFQVGAYEGVIARTRWPDLESRVSFQMDVLLDLLAAMTTRATLFCLGSVARRFPRLIARARAAGHEIACHGWDHRRLFEMTPDKCAADIKDAKAALEDAGGIAIHGYRAPSFSLTPDRFMVYDTLAELGFAYSSSIYPLKTDHYGLATAPRQPYWIGREGQMLECPMTTYATLGRRWPAAGGGYYRLMPGPIGRHLFFSGSAQTGVPGIFYMHPWEIDPGQPRVREAPAKARFRHRVNQSRMLGKVESLLASASFTTLWDGLARPIIDHRAAP